MAITCPIVLTGISSRVDGSLGLRMVTQELKPDEKVAFFELQNQSCKILIQPDGENATAMKDIKGEFDTKTPSQRVRATMYVVWKHLTDSNQIEISFETFYLRQMEKFIESLKQNLPEK